MDCDLSIVQEVAAMARKKPKGLWSLTPKALHKMASYGYIELGSGVFMLDIPRYWHAYTERI